MTTHCVLLVETDVLVRTPLAAYLRECGYQVCEAVDADEARRILNDAATPIEVALIDVESEAAGGFALAAWIRERFPGTQVVLAGTVAKAAEKAGDLCEAGPALGRPYHHRLVLDHIRRLLAARDRDPDGRAQY